MDTQQLGENGIHVSGEDWAREFQRQLEEGLEAWNSVEEKFLHHRSLWEQDAIDVYEEGEEAWHNAFRQLKLAR